MKKSIALTMVALACLAANVQAAEKLAGNEILAVQKGGVPDKVYTQHQPKLRIATYNIGKNEASDNVADFTALNSAIKKLTPILLPSRKSITKLSAARKSISLRRLPMLTICIMPLVKR